MAELEQQLLLFSGLKAFGIAFGAVTIIYWLSKSKPNYFKYLLRSAVKGSVYGVVSVFTASIVYMGGVIASSLIFGTAMEYFYWIFIVAGLQYIFLAVGWIAAAVQEVDTSRTPTWKAVFTYIAVVSVVSVPLTLWEFQQLTKMREATEELQETKWQSAISEFGQSAEVKFDFDKSSYSIVNGEEVKYNIMLSEIKGEETFRDTKSYVIVEMSTEGDIRNEDRLKREIRRVSREVEEERLREEQRKLNQEASAFYRKLAEKHGIDPAKNTVEPFLNELELLGVRNTGDKFRKQVDYAKAVNTQYGSYFHFEMNFQADVKVLREKVRKTVALLDQLGWIAIDFIVFSDTGGVYDPVIICTMSELEKREMLEGPLDFRMPTNGESSIYEKSCEPMF